MTGSAAARLLEPLESVEPTPELLASDTDLDSIQLAGRRMTADMREALVDATMTLALDAAPSVELTFRDPQRKLLRSGFFGQGNLDGDGVVARVSGVTWRLAGVRKAPDGQLTAVFEDEAVAAFRGIRRVRVAPRGKLTRAQFIMARVREVFPRVKFVCPELNVRQPIASSGTAGKHGLPKTFKVKTATADAHQRRSLQTVLDVGVELGASRKAIEAAVVACITESVARTSATHGEHVGLFQMNAKKGTEAQRRNARFASRWFYATATQALKASPSLSVVQLAERVEGSGNPKAYQRWLDQARGIVSAYLGDDATSKGNRRKAATGRYLFSIGPPGGEKREDYWTGFQRLADEVEWRFFVVAGAAYFVSEPRLFAAAPVLTCSEDDAVVRSLEFDVDAGFHSSEATLVVDAELWSVPPGATVELTDCGPASGRWLVTSYSRSLLHTDATVELRKPRPKLPEPAADDAGNGAKGDASASSGSGLASVRATGSWGGTLAIFDQYVTPFMQRRGLAAGSTKRTPAQNAAAGGAAGSDHLTTSTNAYAVDYPTTSGEDDARALAKDMGISGWKPNSLTRYEVKVDGKRFSVQILWGARIDHADHVHVGIRKA